MAANKKGQYVHVGFDLDPSDENDARVIDILQSWQKTKHGGKKKRFCQAILNYQDPHSDTHAEALLLLQEIYQLLKSGAPITKERQTEIVQKVVNLADVAKFGL